ncbi:MAG TPA: SGNH/GDSL hydrolase family protein [Opitutaceae bacterium]|nr:SGNH/GDSL hydrolase family protein [Opitutaceae bacterium]
MILGALLGHRLIGLYKNTAIALLNTLLLLGCVEMASIGALALLDRRAVEPQAAAMPKQRRPGRLELSYYQSKPWGAAFWKEHLEAEKQSTYAPYVVWKPKPFRGNHVNITADRARLTPNSTCGAGTFRVFVLGGSAAWGFASPDWGTIPAHLQRMWSQGAAPVCVLNLAQNAYVSTQEVIELARRLQVGDVPDLVILYGGYNDANAMFETGQAGVHYMVDGIARKLEPRDDGAAFLFGGLLKRTRTYRLLSRTVASRAEVVASHPRSDSTAPGMRAPASLARKAAETYVANQRIVVGLAREFGFSYHAFLQPALDFGAKPLTSEEQQMRSAHSARIPFLTDVYKRIRVATAANPQFTDLTSVFDTVTTSVYVDRMHINPEGNALVAPRIVEILAERDILAGNFVAHKP